MVGSFRGGLRRQLGFSLAALAAFGVMSLLSGCGGGSSSGSSNNPTAAELYAKQIQVGTFGTYVPGEDPDEQDRDGVDVTTVIRFLGNDHWQLRIQNASDVGFINTFSWHVNGNAGLAGPTHAALLEAVTGSSAGHCVLTPDKEAISCVGLSLRPPKCTCQPGGSFTVNFIAKPDYKWLNSLPEGPKAELKTQYAIFQNSMTQLGDMTPVPYHIPSFIGPEQSEEDLPICAKGQASTSATPCVHGT